VRQPPGPSDEGAAAVEFALVSMLLFGLLFGIVQYGYGFYQLQIASSVLRDAAREASLGLDDCAAFVGAVRADATANGLDGSALTGVSVHWVDSTGQDVTPTTDDYADVTLTYRTFQIGLVPFPATITRHARMPLETLGTVVTACG
jgi:Flp pilus assembly protein TadG